MLVLLSRRSAKRFDRRSPWSLAVSGVNGQTYSSDTHEPELYPPISGLEMVTPGLGDVASTELDSSKNHNLTVEGQKLLGRGEESIYLYASVPQQDSHPDLGGLAAASSGVQLVETKRCCRTRKPTPSSQTRSLGGRLSAKPPANRRRLAKAPSAPRMQSHAIMC